MDSYTARQRIRRWLLWHSAFLLIGLMLMLCQLQAQALRVAISAEDYPPFYYQQAGKLTGLSVDILQVVASELGLTIQWQRLPWSRVVQHVASGKADVITVFYKTDARALQFYYSNESYLRDAIVLLCAEPCQLNFDGDLASLAQQPVAVVRDFSYGPRLDQAAFSKIAVAESDPMLFKLLLNRRLPQGIASLTTVLHSAELKWAKDKIKVLHPPLDYVDIYFAFSKQSATTPEFVAKFDQALRRYKSSAAYTALLQRYQLY
ncbi:transporter substrate-binding domain-containing protein [Rheinheimera aquimaris]|nr:transporter substrate-binding domain-containing protein [Rheinheimera aquimaris]MCB5213602.1 transporter substrate-binding domain-containing protein [Rheinheimera aquimaris]